jgi:hypothetical protein
MSSGGQPQKRFARPHDGLGLRGFVFGAQATKHPSTLQHTLCV